MNIQNYKSIIEETAKHNVRLIAVSKTKPQEAILEFYKQGHKVFGENYVQELVEKHEKLPKDIEWHFLGHLQSKKVKQIAPFVHTIHAVDSLKLLQEIDKRAKQNNRFINCFLQVHIAAEETKFGLSYGELDDLLLKINDEMPTNARIAGLMGMATFTSDEKQIRHEFKELRQKFKEIKERYSSINNSFKEISMGMSSDYKIAIAEGTTMIRVGSLLFGSRN